MPVAQFAQSYRAMKRTLDPNNEEFPEHVDTALADAFGPIKKNYPKYLTAIDTYMTAKQDLLKAIDAFTTRLEQRKVTEDAYQKVVDTYARFRDLGSSFYGPANGIVYAFEPLRKILDLWFENDDSFAESTDYADAFDQFDQILSQLEANDGEAVYRPNDSGAPDLLKQLGEVIGETL